MLAQLHDGAVFDVGGVRLAFTTDSYVVKPLFFPGGDIGSLAVNGTVNDLAMCGARPLHLTAGFILEEGLPIETLHRVTESMADAAREAGVLVVSGDTKVVERGRGDGLYVNTAGVGVIEHNLTIAPDQIQPGDVVILSGDIGRHGVAVLAARGELAFEIPIESDCAPLWRYVESLLNAGVEPHCLRDLTRGGLATAIVELCGKTFDFRVIESAVSIAEEVRGACELLGMDPLYVANEGRFIAIIPPHQCELALATLKQSGCPSAAVIGEAVGDGQGRVWLQTLMGIERTLEMLSGEQAPRIC